MILTTKSINVPKEMEERFEEIRKIITDFCEEKLNDEYKQVCLQLCASLCRKRPSPIVTGKANTWACGIVHSIGTVNFLFDSSGKPYIKAKELYQWFGISESTGNGKSKQIRNLFKIGVMDKNWTLPSMMEGNLMAWMIQLNGLLVDVRYCSLEIQLEAYRKGLIPYLPSEGNSKE